MKRPHLTTSVRRTERWCMYDVSTTVEDILNLTTGVI